ncbi:MAG: hypothetical protein QXP36_11625 [Conexivisphaerales archaeon]
MESAVLIQDEFSVVIGLETLCGCKVEFVAPTNTNVCPVCLTHLGALSVINRQAVEYVVKTALSFNCKIHNLFIMVRKNYFYSDLPRGYQISRYDKLIRPRCNIKTIKRGD